MSPLALKIVHDCLDQQDPYLDLGNCGLVDHDLELGSALDIMLRRCRHLETLILSNEWLDPVSGETHQSRNTGWMNAFKHIPGFIRHLEALKVLVCSGDKYFPWCIQFNGDELPNVYLEKLDLSNNRDELYHRIGAMPRLKQLILTGNNIVHVDRLDRFPVLEELILSNNKISSIIIPSNLSLRVLDLNRNRIDTLHMADLPLSLVSLNLSNNQLTDLKRFEFRQLEALDLSWNDLRRFFSPKRSTRIKSLNLSHNWNLRLGSFGNLAPEMETLNLKSTGINSLKNIGSFPKLKTLDASNNPIRQIGAFRAFPVIEKLNVSASAFTTVDLVGLHNLIALDLSHNELRMITGLEHLHKLKTLNLSVNRFTEFIVPQSLKRLEMLDLTFNYLERIELPEHMPELKELILRRNRLNSVNIPENLPKIEKIDIARNQLTEIVINGGLRTLKTLELRDNVITRAGFPGRLTALSYLNLTRNQLTHIQLPASSLAMELLDLSLNLLTSVDGVELYSHLKVLDVSKNKLSSLVLPSQLPNIRHINLSHNKIVSLTGLNNMPQIKKIDLSYTDIADLDSLAYLLESRKRLKWFAKTWRCNELSFALNLESIPLTNPPIEIVVQGNQVILNYFRDIASQGADQLFEGKMLIVGQPRAGKTSLRYKLSDQERVLPSEDESTKGIAIERLDFDIIDDDGLRKKFYYNVWDFGGQQIYQSTHQFFLTPRSLYALVIDSSKDDDMSSMSYWLQAVELLGGGSPLILLFNSKSGRLLSLDFAPIRSRFPFFKDDYKVNLNALIKDSPTFSREAIKDFKNLKEGIFSHLRKLPLVGVRLPRNWIRIREDLQVVSAQIPHISFNEYKAICMTHDVTDEVQQRELSRIFHDLGVFLHFQDLPILANTIILQNTWATDAVFAILDDNQIIQNNGRFTESDVVRIWTRKAYASKIHHQLLALMVRFELCYQIEKNRTPLYIAPQLLNQSAPANYHWQNTDDILLQYWYDFMPKGVLTRLIIKLHKYIHNVDGMQQVWKNGVMIEGRKLDCSNTYAQITENWDKKRLYLHVQGMYARELLEKVSFVIDDLNDEYFRYIDKADPEKPQWHKMMPCNCPTCSNSTNKHFFRHGKLKEYKEANLQEVRCEVKPFALVKVDSLLQAIKSDKKKLSTIDMQKITNVEIFVSYSSNDRDLRELLIDGLKAQLSVKTQKYNFWSDADINTGQEWENVIDKALQNSNAALILIGGSFAGSTFIREKELPEFFRKKKEEGYLILPVLVRSFDFQGFEAVSKLNFFKTYYNEYGFNKPIDRHKLMPFDVLAENEHTTDKQLNDYFSKLAGHIQQAVDNRL